jgi:putative oxidoreductase
VSRTSKSGSFDLEGWAAVPLRLIVGYGFVAHGYAKVVNGPEHFAASLHALGVPASSLMAWVTIVTELAGGFAVLAGAWVWTLPETVGARIEV